MSERMQAELLATQILRMCLAGFPQRIIDMKRDQLRDLVGSIVEL